MLDKKYFQIIPVILIIVYSISGISFAYGEPFHYKQVSFKQHYANTIVDGLYPMFTVKGISNKKLQKANTEVKRYAHKLFKKFFSYDDSIRKAIKEDLPTFKKKSTFGIEFRVIRADSRFVSIVFETYIFNEGMAHPYEGVYGFNYDLRNSRTLQLSDLFEKHIDYIKQVSNYCNLDLDRRSIKNSNLTIDREDIDQFSFGSKVLSIHFQDGQVYSHPAGTPEVKIPFNKLVGLRKDFSL